MNFKNYTYLLLIVIGTFLLSQAALAEIAIIVHPANAESSLSK